MILIQCDNLTEVQKLDYTNLIKSKPSSLFYQSLPYHRLLVDHLTCESRYLLWYDDDILIAAMTFLFKSDPQYGTVVNSLPYYGSNGGLCLSSKILPSQEKEIKQELPNVLNDLYSTLGVVLSTIISNPLEPEEIAWMMEILPHDRQDYRIGQITKLPDHSEHVSEDIMSMISNPRPRNIRRAIKANISVEVRHDLEALKFLFEVHKQNIESIGGKAKRWSFFEKIPEYFKEEEYSVFVAYKDGAPIAALLLFYFNKTVEYFTPATIHDYRNDQPSALLIFEAMKDSVHRGFSNWNWGGTWNSQTGVYDFKKKWGAEDHEYKYFIKIVDEKIMIHSITDLSVAFPNFYLYPY